MAELPKEVLPLASTEKRPTTMQIREFSQKNTQAAALHKSFLWPAVETISGGTGGENHAGKLLPA